MHEPIATIPILELIPQRPPMVMVDRLVMADGEGAESELEVRPDNLFLEEGSLSEAGLVENMAQTAAARSGWIGRTEGRTPDVGFIGSVQKLDVHFRPGTGDVLRTRIRIAHTVMNAVIAEATVRVGEEVAARCTLSIFINP